MASSPQHEPTMEEILASIRKIISEDSSDAPAAASAAPPVDAAPLEADVLDLTQEIHDEAPPPPPVIAAPPPAPEPAALQSEPEPVAPEPVPEHVTENDVEFQTIEEESPVSSEAQATAPHEGIFSDKTRKALEDSFASIPAQRPEPVAAAAPAQAAPAPAADGSSVQDVFEKAVRDGFEPVLHKWLGDNSDEVVEKLKPLVRQWMDDHFPALLELAVRAEVERVARARH